jgi:hypothetical protein
LGSWFTAAKPVAVFFMAIFEVVLGASVSASAQPVPTGITAAQFTDPRVVDVFANCIVERHYSEAVTYVLNSYESWRARPLSVPSQLKDRKCIPAHVLKSDGDLLPKLSENSIEVALAVALVRREYPTFDAALIETAKPLPSGHLVDELFPPEACKKCDAKQMAEFQDARVKLNRVMAPIVFGECAVRSDPRDAHALIMAERGSAEERAVIGSLAPALSSCVVQGAQFTVTPSVLRGLAAISYYRVAHAPRVIAGTANQKPD